MQHHSFKIQCFSLFLALMTLYVYFSYGAYAQDLQGKQDAKSPYAVTGLPIPRYVSFASDKIYMRTGPGQKYPVLFEYNRKNLPVEIILEFDVWRKIRDYEGSEGWVHKSLLSGKRFVMVRSENPVDMLRKPEDGSRLMARIENGTIAALDTCEGIWCNIESQGYSGWVQRKFLWGVYDTEQFN